MTKANGSEWLNICVDCGNRVTTHGVELPGQCPKCHGYRWLCHLVNKNKDKPLTFTEKITEPTQRYKDIRKEFCHPTNDAVASSPLVDTIHELPPKKRGKRGRKLVAAPDDLIRQLSTEGLGAKRIAAKLNEQGISVSYKTIQRRLQGSLL